MSLRVCECVYECVYECERVYVNLVLETLA